MATSSISVRDFIYFLPHPIPAGIPIPYTPHLPSDPLNCGSPNEPTSTIVLTSPTGTFVDLRIYKPRSDSEPELPNQGGPMSRLSWGFAGKSTSIPLPLPSPELKPQNQGQDQSPESGKSDNDEEKEEKDAHPLEIRHAHWTHWVDNLYPIGVIPPKDEGKMYLLPSGREVEVGTLASPHTGELCTYEEMWREVPIQMCNREEKKWCVVLRIEDVARQTRGLVIRLGQYCQGILKVGDITTVERWQFNYREGVDERYGLGEWTRTVRLGDLFLPCAIAIKPDLKVGNAVNYGDMVWNVEEVVSW